MKIKRYLIVTAAGDVRIVQKNPRLRLDEIAVPVTVTLPAGWGRILPDGIEIVLPDVPLVGPIGEPILAETDGE